MVARAWFRTATLLFLVHILCASGEEGGASELPQTSADFFATFSCNDVEIGMLLDSDGGDDDAFYRWVLAGRHPTWHPGWEVALPKPPDDAGDGKFYARVFSLLNWARKKKLLPMPVDIQSICHKGMEAQYIGDRVRWSDANHPPAKPNAHITTETWTNLWDDCNSQLLSATRLSTACIDVPGMLVTNPNPPWKSNNPCHRDFRMVDGAHRLCLRKYALALLHGELTELEELANQSDGVQKEIEHKQMLIKETSRGAYLIVDQITFQSLLISGSPHETWARSKEHLMKELPEEDRQDWKEWMALVFDNVRSEL